MFHWSDVGTLSDRITQPENTGPEQTPVMKVEEGTAYELPCVIFLSNSTSVQGNRSCESKLKLLLKFLLNCKFKPTTYGCFFLFFFRYYSWWIWCATCSQENTFLHNESCHSFICSLSWIPLFYGYLLKIVKIKDCVTNLIWKCKRELVQWQHISFL